MAARRKAAFELGNMVIQRGRLEQALADLNAKIEGYEADVLAIDKVLGLFPEEKPPQE